MDSAEDGNEIASSDGARPNLPNNGEAILYTELNALLAERALLLGEADRLPL